MYLSSLKVQINEKLLLNESIQWSRIIERKIKHAINFSALRKALESDDMSFAIVQRAYKSILKIFNLMYLNLIESDYHSKIWREGTEIILKKSNKSNCSISKTYRIITLLNCLDKIAKKLITMRLSYTAKTNDKLLDFDQMRGRKQRSAIDAVLNLVHDAQMAKSRENTLTCLLLDVKDIFDHVMLKQLIKILIKQKILINLINWVKYFLQNRIIDLAFDEEHQKSKEIFTEILQESFISLILFLIYIRHLFLKIRARIENLQSFSYIDDVALYIEGKSIDKNVKKLKKTTKIAFTWANENAVQFDNSKFELIHFENHKATLNQTIMLLNDTVVKSKICIWWLEVWLNRKLNFKMHVQTKIVAVTRTLHSLFKLMNSEWELNAKSERQLYLACVTIISDYDVEIWWNNQKSHAIKFRKLQNAALRKILKAFWTSFIEVMQIEAEISSVKVQLDQKCKNYAIKIVELSKKHSTRKRTLISYSSQYSIKLNLDLNTSKYLNWNKMKMIFILFFYFFIKCMQPMTMTLSRRCMYAKLHVIWPKSLLYIFSLVNHIDSLRIQALFLNPRHRTFVFLCSFALFAFYSFVPNSHFLVAIQVFFKYSSVAILPILVMNSVNIVSVFLSWAFSLSFICSAL